MPLRRPRGFTLIEVMIVVAIVGILLAVAFPSYRQYIVRSNRAAAQSQMLDIANRQQQFLLNTRSYVAHSDALWTATGFTLPPEVSRNYTYAIEVASVPPAFTVTFTPVAGGGQQADGVLTFNSQGVKLRDDPTKAPPDNLVPW